MACLVTGAGVVSAAALGMAALMRQLGVDAGQPSPVTGLYLEKLPYPSAFAFVDFDARALLGRKSEERSD